MWSISSPLSPQRRRRSVAGRLVGALVAGILLTLLLTSHVLAAGPPSQTYYVPVPEDQALAALQTLYPGYDVCGDTPTGNQSASAAPVYTYLSISVIADGTVEPMTTGRTALSLTRPTPPRRLRRSGATAMRATARRPASPATCCTAARSSSCNPR